MASIKINFNCNKDMIFARQNYTPHTLRTDKSRMGPDDFQRKFSDLVKGL